MTDNNIESQQSTAEKEKILEDFIMDIDCLDKLNKWTNKLNFFDILSMSGMEIRHSNFLAWLLNPRAQHGLGDYFIRKILLKSAKMYGPENTPIPLVDLDGIQLDDVRIQREESDIDILAVSDKSNLVLTIENKLHSQEHDDQLEKYYTCVCNNYPKHRRFFVYLTLDGDAPSDDEWVPMSHEYIRALVKSILENKDLPDRCRIYLEDYSNTLAGELMNDEELKKTCNEIYKNHKDAFDLILANLPNDQTEIFDRCKSLLDKYEKENRILQLTHGRSTLRFTTPRIRAKGGQVGYDTYIKERDLFFFEIETTRSNNRYMTFYLGPGESKYRKPWYEYLKENAMDRKQQRELTDSYTGIQIKRLKTEKSGEEYVKMFVSRVSEYLEYIPNLERIIESAPINYENL